MKEVFGCEFLTERQEIGKAMNFGKYPVLWMDIGNPKKVITEGDHYTGCKARFAYQTRSCGELIYSGTLDMYADEQKPEVRYAPWLWDHIHLSSWGSCLKADFGYGDVIEDLENAMAPMIQPGQEVIVVFKNEVKKSVSVRKMVTSSRVDPHCSSMMMIENRKKTEE